MKGMDRISFDLLTDDNKIRKFKIADCQNGHAYLTSHRICYIDDADPRNHSLAIDLRDVERQEYQVRLPFL